MTTPRNFLDNLKNLRVVMSVALEHVRENHNKFVNDVSQNQMPEFELSINQIRMLAEQLQMELSTLEHLIAMRHNRA